MTIDVTPFIASDCAPGLTARDLPTWVQLSAADPLTGYANADCRAQLAKDELGEYLGALSPPSMRVVNQAVAIAWPRSEPVIVA
jgi:mRNA-degrading endonuclease toxin of MazEF toxin-antitoxin module